ncbi:isoleucine--tRNA ligase [Candidatus Roizmanbacteria bacterium]|nr:isoleucine--tRNA ligase [Candidatus Roizmanbacteria bacterium]
MFKPVDSKADFVKMELKWLKHWYGRGIIGKYLEKNEKSEKRFSFLDGPITANNPMGVHHAWGRTYKDIWQRFFNLLGYRQRFQNGFDCQGLWVEVEVEKELGLTNKKEIEDLVPGDRKASIAKFVSLCKERVLRFSKLQTEQTKRLGNFMDWEHSYFTMSDENNYMIWHFLKTCHENGWIYKGRESVPWCPRCETAISQHEMLTENYKEAVHESIYFELPVTGKKNEYLLVWTTTPWTIPANIAVAIDTKLDYSLVEGNSGDLFWVAKDLIEKVFKKKYKGIVKTVKGSKLVGLKYKGPFDHLEAVKKVAEENPKSFHIVIATDELILPISKEEGTGLVHTAVSAGVEDFKLGKKYNLPMVSVIADNADYLPGLGFLSGKNAKRNPRVVLNYLLEQEKKGENWVLEIHNYKHRYPACWRCGTELVWKVTDEWYIAMDKPAKVKRGGTLREQMVTVAKKIHWIPEFGLDRELDWLKNMHDWLISKKNRYWGLALPIYECRKCGEFEVIGSKEELKKRAVEGWDKFMGHSPHKPYIDEVVIACTKCKERTKRIDDVGNPWLDAGIVPFSTITEHNQGQPLYLENQEEWRKWYPVDFITESFPGQFKNWFYALIAMSTVLENTNPFKTVLGFATLLAEDGRAMHKSWGNMIEFYEGAEKIGVDVMRWMYTRQNPRENMFFGYKHADDTRRHFYLILWNVYKFFVEYANLDKFHPKLSNSLNPPTSQNIIDRWILSRFTRLVLDTEKNLRSYNTKDSAYEIERFVNDLSTWYIRRSRDRVWINSEDQADKKNFYATLYYVLTNLSIILSPFLPFLSEEIYVNLTKEKSVHLSEWPRVKKLFINDKLEKEMEVVLEIVEKAHAERKEEKIKVRQPLAALTVTTPNAVSSDVTGLIANEVNVKQIKYKRGKALSIKLDTKITAKLQKEGELRDLVRKIQDARKKMGLLPTQKINITLPDKFEEFADYIRKKTSVAKISFGKELKFR